MLYLLSVNNYTFSLLRFCVPNFVGTLLLRFYGCDIRVYILFMFCYSI